MKMVIQPNMTPLGGCNQGVEGDYLVAAEIRTLVRKKNEYISEMRKNIILS